MGETKSTVLVTGISGNLGLRLLPQLAGFNVLGVDLNPPQTDLPLSFERMDLGQEESCRQLYLLMRQISPVAVVHLAFVIDPVRTGVLDVDRMWQINVAGTARVMEAITEANRDVDLPHSVNVQYSRANWIDDECQMHDRNRIGLTHQQIELAAGFFLTQVHAFKAERKIGLRRVQIDSNNIEVGQLRQKSKAEIPGDSRDQNRWFRFAHLLRTRFRNLRRRLDCSGLGWRLLGPCRSLAEIFFIEHRVG